MVEVREGSFRTTCNDFFSLPLRTRELGVLLAISTVASMETLLRGRQQAKKGQRLSSNPGPTLFHGASATTITLHSTSLEA